MRALLLLAVFSLVTPFVSAQNEKDTTMFPVQDDTVTHYINKRGEVVLTVPYLAEPFSDGLARIWVNGKTGYVDRSGRVVVEPQSISSVDFSEGLAIFYVASDCARAENKNYYGFIDRQGKVAIKPTLYRPCNYWGNDFDFKKDGLALTQVESGWGFVNKTGEIVMKFEDAGYFSEGLAPAKKKGKFGFVDTSGRFVIPPQFEAAKSFAEGLAAVRLNGKTGFVDRSGKMVITASFDDATYFSDGMAPVKIGEKWGYIDRTGKLAVDLSNNYTYAHPFSSGRAIISVDNEQGYIDRNGKVVIDALFSRANDFQDGLAYVFDSESRRWQVVDINGDVVYRNPQARQPPPDLNNPFVKVSLSNDIKWLESVASAASAGEDSFQGQGLANQTKDVSTAAYARLGELATPESLDAIKRLESAARKNRSITPEFLPLGVSFHPGWHFSDSERRPIAQVTSASGTAYGVLLEATLGSIDLFLITNRTPTNPKTWTRPKLLPNRFYWGLQGPKLSMKGSDTLVFSFVQHQPPPRPIMDGTLDPRDKAPVLGANQIEISIKAVEADTDGDGWTDLEEERLGLNPRMKDSDGDGLSDGEDTSPNAVIPEASSEDELILQRALFAVFGLGGSRYLLMPDDKTQRVEIWGYKGPIIYGYNVASWTGKNRTAGVFVKWRIRRKTETQAIVEIVDYEGPLAAGGQDVRLKKIGNEWFVYNRRTTWVS